jgi:hypothetical protein
MHNALSTSAPRSSSVILGDSCLSATSSDRTDSYVRVEHARAPGTAGLPLHPQRPSLVSARCRMPRGDHEAAVGHAPDRASDVVRVKPLAHGSGLDGHAAQADVLCHCQKSGSAIARKSPCAIAPAVVTARRAQRKQLGDQRVLGRALVVFLLTETSVQRSYHAQD